MATLKTCIVCGMGSHRTDWINVSGEYVACDKHSVKQMTEAIAKAEAPPVVASDEPRSTPSTASVQGQATPAPAAPATPAPTAGAPATAAQVAAATSGSVVVK